MIALGGKVAVITGASRGIGLAIADALEAEDAYVVRLARSLDAEIPAPPADGPDRRIDLRCDCTSEADLARAAAVVLETVGPPDILVNNAGAFFLAPLAATPLDAFRHQLEANLVTAFLVARTFLPPMAERGRGHLVTIGSIADHVALPGNTAYAAAKFGLRGLHDVLAAEFTPRGLRATLLSPGATDTTLWDPIGPDARPDLPNRASMLRPADVAAAVVFALTRPDGVEVESLTLGPARGR
ncbi:MAG TPA: SDR family oxidoreductase [Gemmatimonadales bacterium]|nr:SDR family oxidoreductase [Gemmatimonadales bacterium]